MASGTTLDALVVALFTLIVGAAVGYSLQPKRHSPLASAKKQPPAREDDTVSYTKKDATATAQDGDTKSSIRLVIQRFRKASLLVDESEIVTVGSDNGASITTTASDDSSCSSFAGILVYASFAKSATKEKVLQAAKTLLNLPILTQGVWGDGSMPQSVLDLAGSATRVAVVLVPQANLISKVRSQGRSIQYHGQIDKTAGQALYEYLVECVKAICLQHQYMTRKEPVPKFAMDFLGKPNKTDASVPPSELFRDATVYSSWDSDGLPLTNAHGEPLTKSALKKLRKQYESHKKRHVKYLKTSGTQQTSSNTTLQWELLDPSFVQVVSGSFGKRQGLEFSSDMGPFCHVVNL